MNKPESYSIKAEELKVVTYSKLQDYALLVKVKLCLVVVITSLLGYVVSASGDANLQDIFILGIGGFLVTAAANALNQVFEKDFDRLMTRTINRPIAAERMKPSEAVLFAGLSCLIGITLLSIFNPLTALLGMVSLIIYSFVYTPMKRYTTLSVAVGAIPGALPVMIGATAFDGRLTLLAISLFGIQFLWQFPHFWAIGYLSFDDYKRAGYKLLPERSGEIDRNLGMSSTMYALMIIPILFFLFTQNVSSVAAFIIVSVLTLLYSYFGYQFHLKFDRPSALRLMFFSFFYLPIVLITYWIF